MFDVKLNLLRNKDYHTPCSFLYILIRCEDQISVSQIRYKRLMWSNRVFSLVLTKIKEQCKLVEPVNDIIDRCHLFLSGVGKLMECYHGVMNVWELLASVPVITLISLSFPT